jgi:hypothetical protein
VKVGRVLVGGEGVAWKRDGQMKKRRSRERERGREGEIEEGGEKERQRGR